MQSDLQTRAEPVYWDDQAGVYIVRGYEEASTVLRSSNYFSSNPNTLGNVFSETGMDSIIGLTSAVVLMDAPDHTRMRRLISPAFSPRVITALAPQVAEIVESILDGLEGKDEADIIADISRVMPPAVISKMLDVGAEGADLVRQQAPRLVRWMELDPTFEDFQAAIEAAMEFDRFLTPIIEKRKRDPGDDFLSILVTTDGLKHEEILSTCFLIFAAGGEATGRLVGNASLRLLRDRSQIPHLLADPVRAVEELLRVEGTSKRLVRFSAVDHDLGGCQIAKGRLIYINVLEANKDLRRAPDADQLDLSREPLSHLTLGAGPHYCLGAALARLQAIETLPRLFRRFPGLTLINPDPPWNPSTTFRGLLELPVRLRG
jgi:cytochrome P450